MGMLRRLPQWDRGFAAGAVQVPEGVRQGRHDFRQPRPVTSGTSPRSIGTAAFSYWEIGR